KWRVGYDIVFSIVPFRSVPRVGGGTGYRTVRGDEQMYGVSGGVAYDVAAKDGERKMNPYLRADAGGVTVQAEGKQGVGAQVRENALFASATARSGSKPGLRMGAMLGPMDAGVNVLNGKFSAGISWPMIAFQTIMAGIKRAGESRKIVPLNESGNIRLDGITKGMEISAKLIVESGGKYDEKDLKLKVSEVLKVKRSKEGILEVEFKADGKKYVAKLESEQWDVMSAPEPGNQVVIYEKPGRLGSVGRFLKRFFHPGKVAQDVFKIMVISPVLGVKDTYHAFKKPIGEIFDPAKMKIYKSKDEYVLDCEKKMRRATEEGFFSSARHYAYDLVANSSGVARAGYMRFLDRIEWAIANRGFPLGYISGVGFGRKKKMVEQEIAGRMENAIHVLEIGMKLGKIRGGKSEERQATEAERDEAFLYLDMKMTFRTNPKGRIIPVEPLPPSLINKAIKALKSEQERRNTASPDVTRGESLDEDVKVEFRKLTVKDASLQRIFRNYTKIVQRIYEKTDDPLCKATLKNVYMNLTEKYTDEAMGEQYKANRAASFAEEFERAGIIKGKFGELTEEQIGRLTPEQLKKAYDAAYGPSPTLQP
ncbi:MAG: hypothetical protein WC488_02480, partial [Candidatus Micrarchaeia archaeon]